MEDFDEYIRQGEGSKYEKGQAWRTAIGLQDVDGLKTSEYLVQTARKHIEGDITIEEVKELLNSYYRQKTNRLTVDVDRVEEADKVSARIAELLSEDTFTFSPIAFISIHRRLFQGIYKHAGLIRNYNISKREWVLQGESVQYAGCVDLKATLDYDFDKERAFNYQGLSMVEVIEHIAHFIADLWQIHPFGEGNTRTTAVFCIKYLRSFGFNVNNNLFSEHSWYFRNALVRANYNNLTKGIHATTIYLVRFLRNLLLSEENELKNRALLVSTEENVISQSATGEDPKCNHCTLNCTLDELVVLNAMKENPKITQKELARRTGKSERTIKTITSGLSERGLVIRRNGRRNGYWEVGTVDSGQLTSDS